MSFPFLPGPSHVAARWTAPPQSLALAFRRGWVLRRISDSWELRTTKFLWYLMKYGGKYDNYGAIRWDDTIGIMIIQQLWYHNMRWYQRSFDVEQHLWYLYNNWWGCFYGYGSGVVCMPATASLAQCDPPPASATSKRLLRVHIHVRVPLKRHLASHSNWWLSGKMRMQFRCRWWEWCTIEHEDSWGGEE